MKARVIIPVWGTKYLGRMDAACLPALLAPGNLPHLAEHFECELVIVTEAALFDEVRNLPSIRRAAQYAALRLVAVDDVLSHPFYYGLTITHALFRGFSDLGEAAQDVWCLFLNADFILADGSYRGLVKRMLAGERCIFSPSYCVIEEEVRPALNSGAVAGAGVLSIKPREMAGLILDHKHFTIRAKIINWKMYRIDRVDQFYYQHDNDTLIGRQLPIAIVAFRPERVPPEPVTFWDYGVVAEVCPTAPLCVLGDSDDFLMLELRGRETMQGQLKLGWMNPDEIARDLSLWTTKDQRDCGEFTLVLHRHDLPSNYREGVKQLDDYYRGVMRQVVPEPRDHRNHYIWTGVVTLHEEWLRSRQALEADGSTAIDTKINSNPRSGITRLLLGLLKEILLAPFGRGSAGISQQLFDLLRAIYLRLYGRMPDIGLLHPQYIDIQPLLSYIKKLSADGNSPNVLGVWSMSGAAAAPFLNRWIGRTTNASPGDLLSDDGLMALQAKAPFDTCILELDADEFLSYGKLHARLRGLLKKGGRILVFCQTHGIGSIPERYFKLIAHGLPDCDIGELEMRGNWPSYVAQKLWTIGRRKAESGKALDLVQFALLGLAVSVLSALANRFSRNRHLGTYKPSCTSLLLKITVV
jgi:hypothetical protein